MEASSHGLDQRRLDGVRWRRRLHQSRPRPHGLPSDAGGVSRRQDAALRHAAAAGAPAIIFADDEWSAAPTIAGAEKAGLDVRTVGRKGDFLQLKRVEHERYRQRAEMVAEGRIHEIDLPLAGGFQLSNALVAAGLAISTGVSPRQGAGCAGASRGAPGRLELVGTAANGAPAYVDYAHKPEALENVLSSVRPFTTGRSSSCSAAAATATGKRPIMGEIAARLADVVIVTDDNPRSEEPARSAPQIMAAAPGATEIGDRREAIRHAVACCSPATR
jgi:UDP-N-acetylmuramoyl-L-alanyl-D-glutamate--2,6-diaminopimelate ligase